MNPSITRDEILFDRQTRLWGQHGQRHLRQTKILALGASATITETLKGLVLPTIQSFTLVDTDHVNAYHISNNFFLTTKDLGESLPKAVARNLQKLNPTCQYTIHDDIPMSDYVLILLYNTLQQQLSPNSLDDQDFYHYLLDHHPETTQLYSLLLENGDDHTDEKHTKQQPLTTTMSDIAPPTHPPQQPTPHHRTRHQDTLLDYTTILLDPVRLPLPVIDVLSHFCLQFHLPLVLTGSYATFSLVKLIYPMRCTIETHYNQINPANNNLYLYYQQLVRFFPLQQLYKKYSNNADEGHSTSSLITMQCPSKTTHLVIGTTNNGMDDQDARITNTTTTPTYLDLLAMRSKIPHPMILYTALQEYTRQKYNNQLQHSDHFLHLTTKDDFVEVQTLLRSFRWAQEENFIEAEQHLRMIFTPPRIQPALLEVLNHQNVHIGSINQIGNDNHDLSSLHINTTHAVRNTEQMYSLQSNVETNQNDNVDQRAQTITTKQHDAFDLSHFINFSHLYKQTLEFSKMMITPSAIRPVAPSSKIECATQQQQHDKKQTVKPHFPISYRNHYFWIFVAALRLFIFNYPLEYCFKQRLHHKKDQDVVLSHLNTFLQNNSHFAMFPKNPTSYPALLPADIFQHKDGVTTVNDNVFDFLTTLQQQQQESYQRHFSPSHHDAKNKHYTHGTMPIPITTFPDMTSSTEQYLELKHAYHLQYFVDYSIFTIYLFIALQYYNQHHPNNNNNNNSELALDQEWFNSLGGFVEHTKAQLLVQDPVHHFLTHCRELRVNQGVHSAVNVCISPIIPLQSVNSDLANQHEKVNNFFEMLTPRFLHSRSIAHKQFLSGVNTASNTLVDAVDINSTNVFATFGEQLKTQQTITSSQSVEKSNQKLCDLYQDGVNNQYIPYLFDYYCSFLSYLGTKHLLSFPNITPATRTTPLFPPTTKTHFSLQQQFGKQFCYDISTNLFDVLYKNAANGNGVSKNNQGDNEDDDSGDHDQLSTILSQILPHHTLYL